MRNTRNSKCGFTLVETIWSIALITILIPPAINNILNNQFLSSYSKHKMQAAYVAQQILEQERRAAFSEIVSVPPAFVSLDTRGTYNTTVDDFMGNAIITVTDVDANQKMVQVEINWTERIFGRGQVVMREYFTTTFANEPDLN